MSGCASGIGPQPLSLVQIRMLAGQFSVMTLGQVTVVALAVAVQPLASVTVTV